MNVVSLNLCKELHEISGWGGTNPLASYETGLMWRYGDDYEFMALDYSSWSKGNKRIAGMHAYDLGYLLRKLPHFELIFNGMTYWCNYESEDNLQPDTECWGKTPEDAACKLCIELI